MATRDDKIYNGVYRRRLKKDYIDQLNKLRLVLGMPLLTTLEKVINTVETLELEMIRLLDKIALPDTTINDIKPKRIIRYKYIYVLPDDYLPNIYQVKLVLDNKRRKTIGSYPTLEKAIIARNSAILKYPTKRLLRCLNEEK